MGVYLAGHKRISHSFCKIHQIHDFFIASAGFFDTRTGQRLNIKEVVTGVAWKGDPLAVTVNRSSSAIASALSQALAEAREDDGLYNLLVRGRIVTVFFGFEDKKPSTSLVSDTFQNKISWLGSWLKFSLSAQAVRS
jgi:hypothetical protein